ncbi:flagellin N-terminal helical domain-containing protein [Butyrivibrio sp. NC2002]|jgi:flagellin-like hook-associated protein FlgL|uniref:flagellin N-terminal helical domain-containing protein n=1 Tax=Butyrivibrio sp. NC2002 TaxID=1410610 RepID=UPI00068D5213|nr:flagellin [Butyrivibrio sp. NC2002]
MQVNYNISAMIANNALASNDNKLAESIERLSSGLKIANAKDNPSGLAMARRMHAQIRSLKQAGNNSGDGISIMATADGALNEVHDMLQRMSELAIQATNGTNSDNDRKTIQDEIDQLKEEITRIAETTQFNGQNLLDGSFDLRGYATTGDAVAGQNVTDPNITVNEYSSNVDPGNYVIEGLTAKFNKRIGELDITDMGSEYIKIYKYDPITKQIDRDNPYMSDARITTDGDIIRMETKDDRYIEIRVTEDLDNATVNLELTGKGDMTLQIGANEGVTLNARIPTISLDNLGLVYTDFTRTIYEDVEANVKNLTTGDISGNTPYSDVWLGTKYATSYYFYYENIENNTKDFYTTTDYLDKMQKYSNMLSQYAELQGNPAYQAIADDINELLKGNGVSDSFPDVNEGLDKEEIVGTFIEKYFVAATQQQALDSYDLDTYSNTTARNIYTILTTDIVGVTPKDNTETRQASIDTFQALFQDMDTLYQAETGESLMDNITPTGDPETDVENFVKYYGLTKQDLATLKEANDNNTLTGAQVKDIVSASKANFLTQAESNDKKSTEEWNKYLSYADYLNEYKATVQADYDLIMSKVTPDMSEEQISFIKLEAQPYKDILDNITEITNTIDRIDKAVDVDFSPVTDADKVRMFANEYFIDEPVQKVLDKTLENTEMTDEIKGKKIYETLRYSNEKGKTAPNTGADQAIRDISSAIQKVSNIRARLGAYQNRLEHTSKSINVVDENMTAAYSRIMDVDMAEEMTVYSTQQVLSQAGTSMLAQANERPSQVLQLLQ